MSNSIKPHEQRALNFLINEYLLLHGYKLTSITFADENENQVSFTETSFVAFLGLRFKICVYIIG